jgi:DNA-binding beta-propeller fold protein YncE
MRTLVILAAALATLVLAQVAPARPGADPAPPAARAVAAGTGVCAPWRVRTLLQGQGWLENLAFDGRGGITLSALADGKLLLLSASGRLSTLDGPVSAPGAQVRRGRVLSFVTGDAPSPAPVGTVDRLDLRTGRRSTWAAGLTSPNGLAFLPNGDAIVSRTSGTGTGLTRIRARDPRHPQLGWAKLDDTNGLALDRARRKLYVARTLSADGEITVVQVADPRRTSVAGRLGPGVLPDDLTRDRRGVLYVAGFGSGAIHRLDPRTHRSCPIASGLEHPTSARFGGPGRHVRHLYVTDAGGHLSELIPPRRPRR